MEKKYEILEHPADLKIRAFGKTKEELFLNMMTGMSENMRPEISKLDSAASTAKIKKPEQNIKRKIKIKSPDLSALLVDFLSEILYLSQTNKETYNDVKFIKFTDTELEAEISGQKVERFGEDIKAVTYHQLEISQDKDGNWAAAILFDI